MTTPSSNGCGMASARVTWASVCSCMNLFRTKPNWPTAWPEPGSTNAFSEITFVTQPGAASVTNPSDDAQAEVVKLRVYAPDGGPLTYDNPRLQTRSSLLPFGQTTLTTNEFLSFAALIESLRAAYGAMFPAKTNYVLDLEYKKITPAALIIKQIREIPVAPSSNQYPFLISQPTEYVIWQGENTELDFNHALKIRARFTTKNLLLTETNFATTFFTALHLDYTDGSNVLHLDLEGDALTNLQHLVDGDWITDTLPPAADRPGFVFSMRKPQRISTTQNPWWTLADLELRRLGDDNHFVRLVPAPVITSTDSLQTRHGTYSFTLGATNLTVSITTRFYWPDQAGIAQAANTAPLLQFVSTTIEGLTTAPLLLTNHFSQTCAPSHHNLNDSFLFEPRLDANVTPAQLSELNTLNIRALHFRTGIGDCAENCTFIYPLVLVDD
jgi:hypothetical protein